MHGSLFQFGAQAQSVALDDAVVLQARQAGDRGSAPQAQFSSAITLNGNSILSTGAALVVTDVAVTNLSSFKTAWGLSGGTAVASVDGPGLGKEDVVVFFDKLGNVATAFNYDLTAVFASDGTLITTAPAGNGATFRTRARPTV